VTSIKNNFPIFQLTVCLFKRYEFGDKIIQVSTIDIETLHLGCQMFANVINSVLEICLSINRVFKTAIAE
jgi:hypothetical protein